MVADSPIQYDAVLADLEARKESLRNRLDGLDSAISGIRSLAGLTQEVEVPQAAPIAHETAQPVREAVQQPVRLTANQQPVPAPQHRRTVARAEASLQRPIQTAPPERRRTPGLNVYVNQHPEWAAQQIIAPTSRRSIFRQKTGHNCPKCGSGDTRVSVTRGLSDVFMFLFDYSIGRCRNCDTRFRIWRSREEEPDQDLQAEPATES
jgi:hypothetical protein